MNDDDDADDELPSTDQPTVDAADTREYRKRGRRKKRADLEADQFWRDTMSTELGRRTLWGVLQAAHTFEARFACGPNGFPQPESTWFQAGEQGFGLRLYLSWVRICPDQVHAMHLENDPNFVRPRVKS